MSEKIYGPANPHPLSQLRTELVWEGKYDEYGNRREIDVAGLSMPMQKIETIDQPRSEAAAKGQLAMFEKQTKRLDDFRNRLIWGDNKLVVASLLKDFKGSVDLIYIDPPFDVGADFTMGVPYGDLNDTIEKDQSALEMVAYRDMWGLGTDSYLHMLFERVLLARELLKESGNLFIHIGVNVSNLVRSMVTEIMGVESFQNEIVWQRHDPHNDARTRLGTVTDRILWFGRSAKPYYDSDAQRDELSDSGESEFSLLEMKDGTVIPFKSNEHLEGRRFKLDDATWKGTSSQKRFTWRGARPSPKREWMYNIEGMEAALKSGELYLRDTDVGAARCRKRYLDENKGIYLQDLWTNVGRMKGGSDYPTQKPEPLLERIVNIGSPAGGLVVDVFSGSGTTGVVAERLGRRWIMADLGRFAIHISRKRLIDLQRSLHNDEQPYRAFDVYNLGRYERQWWQKASLQGADEEHRRVVLEFFQAEQLSNAPSPLIHGRKGRAFCHVASIDSMFSRDQAREVAKAVAAMGGQECFCLAWEFEMDLRLTLSALEQETGVKLKPIPIPREIMERNRKSPPPFLEMAVLEAEPVYRGGKTNRTVDIKLTKFLPSLAEVPTKELEALKERAVKSGFDFIDFWAIDFDWHPEMPFNHHWQDYRTRKDRSLKTVSEAGHQYPGPGKYTACVKVVDVFGCDTSITVEVTI
jgi:adenine-specific DNA-methyltransferase